MWCEKNYDFVKNRCFYGKQNSINQDNLINFTNKLKYGKRNREDKY